MPEPQNLTDRILDQVVELVRDHRPLLADLAERLEPQSKELVDAWVKAFHEAQLRQPPLPDEIVRATQEQTVRLLLGKLRQNDLRLYFSDVADWARELTRSGLSFDCVLVLLRGYQRSTVPLLRRLYPAGPELQMAFSALDALYAGLVTLIGAVYIESAQEQLIHGARLRTLGQLANGAAHSLNNLFTAILGRTQLLLEHTRQPEPRSELQEVLRSAATGAQMVRRLQDLVSTNGDEKFIESDINVLVREVAEITRFLWRDQAEANGIVIDVIKDLAEVPPVVARPTDLREALVALVVNAIEVMPRGGMITLRTERKGDRVLLSVTDTGEGIPEVLRSRIFEPFFTTKGPAHPGLGLSTAASIVTQHEGTLTVSSEPGRGSTFTLSLPMAPRTEAAGPVAATPQPVTVLIIDDERPVRDVVARFLTFRGYPVVIADSGPEGLAAFKQKRFDLVITDLGMPGMSGWEVAREVKRLKPKTLVVLMTGWMTDLDALKVKESGVDRVVHKPFDVDEILTLVNEAAAVREKM